MNREQNLWRAVVWQAVSDLLPLNSASEVSAHWLLTPSKDREMVFNWAGFDEPKFGRLMGFIHRYCLIARDGKNPKFDQKEKKYQFADATKGQAEVAERIIRKINLVEERPFGVRDVLSVLEEMKKTDREPRE